MTLKDQQKKAREALDKYDQEYSNAVYDQMEHFRTNPSNGNRYFEEIKELARKKYETLLDSQIQQAYEVGKQTIITKLPTPPEYGEPMSTFIQWKGTDVCMDWHCICGEHNHEDRDFCYEVECPICKRKYKVGDNVGLTVITSQKE